MNEKIDRYLYQRIVPDLLNGRKISSINESETHNTRSVNRSHIQDFSRLVMDTQTEQANEIVQNYLDAGFSACQIVEQLLCECAHDLGERWSLDDISIAEVSLGMVALHKVLRDLDDSLSMELGQNSPDQSILLITLPQDNHLFGVAVLESFFRNSGWHVRVKNDHSASSILDEVSTTYYSAVGISVSQNRHIDLCRNMITKIRHRSKNQDSKILVGGFPFTRDDALGEKVGADIVANNAMAALRAADSFLSQTA